MPRVPTKKPDILSHLFDLKEATILGVKLAEQPVEVVFQNRSRYTTIPASRKASLGIGYLKAVGAILCGLVETFETNAEGTVGRATILSSASTTRYDMSWDVRNPSLLLFGGFRQKLPSYQVAILHLIACITNPNNTSTQHWSQEVFQRWQECLQTIHTKYPYSQQAPYWESIQVQDICNTPSLKASIEAISDALYFCLRYKLPDTGETAKRMILFTEDSVVPTNQHLTQAGDGTRLLGFFGAAFSAQSLPTGQRSIIPASNTICCPNPLCQLDNPASETYCTNCGAYLDPAFVVPPTTPPVPIALSGGLATLHPQYTDFQEVGRGGMGIVYKARDGVLDRHVAIKERNMSGLDPQKAVEASNAFKREACFIASLDHPCIPKVYEYRETRDQHFLVMDFIDGLPLDLYMQHTGLPVDPRDPVSRRRLSIKHVLEIGVTLCGVLNYLHTRTPKIIYRDLKLENVMITKEGYLYLVDFGTARHFKSGQSRDTIALGSVGFAAPEQYGKKYQTDERSDIYSLGATLHALLTGLDPSESPFLFDPFIDPPHSVPAPRELETLVLQMVTIEMAKRPSTAAEVLQDLQRIQSALGV